MMDVFTYYDASPAVEVPQADDFRAFDASWSKFGWTPKILTSRRARLSQLFEEVSGRLPNNHDFALPWLALHAAGGGWLVPKSVLNTGFRPARRRAKVIFYHPGILWATRRGCEEILKTAWTKDWDKFFLKHFQTVDLFKHAD
jgi:hypothetical protein